MGELYRKHIPQLLLKSFGIHRLYHLVFARRLAWCAIGPAAVAPQIQKEILSNNFLDDCSS
jgi:hypothetical protein